MDRAAYGTRCGETNISTAKPILNGPSGILIQVISWAERGAERRGLARPRIPQALDPGRSASI
jgi:hypothetical protein